MVVLYTFDQMVEIMQPLRLLRLFETKFNGGELQFVNIRVYQLAEIAISLEFLLVIAAIVQHFNIKGMSGVKPLLTTAILMMVTILRGYFMQRNGQLIAHILNQLEKIFPRNMELQQQYKIDAMVKRVRHRFQVFQIFVVLGLLGFNVKALFTFVEVFRSGNPMNEYCFPIPSWYPFELKQSYAWYPLIYILECIVTLIAALFTMNWNHIYSMVMTHICAHCKYVAKTFAAIDGRNSNSVLTSRKLQEHINGLINQLQLLDKLCVDTNFAFVTPLIIIDTICATTICLQVFIISHEQLFTFAQHIVPVILSSWMIYETSRYGEMLEQASNEVGNGIYNHNWYDGSIEHRKLVLMLLQWRNEPQRLSWGKSFFNINISYFVQINILAYQLYSFQQSLQ